MAVLGAVPLQLVAGDSWRWLIDYPDYPAPTWTVTYYFENRAGSFSAVATASGTAQSVTITPATTTAFLAGDYHWYARAVAGAVTETIPDAMGWLEVVADPGLTGTRDWRSKPRKLADAIDEFFDQKISSNQLDQLSMSISGRSISRMSTPDLWAFKNQLEREADVIEAGKNAGLGRNILVRFN